MYYEELELESNVPEIFKNKPPWLRCIMVAAFLILMTIASVSIGVFIGYTYCYIEHRNGQFPENKYKISANITLSNFTNGTIQESKDRTINTALKDNPIMSKLISIIHYTLLEAMSVENNITNHILKKEMLK